MFAADDGSVASWVPERAEERGDGLLSGRDGAEDFSLAVDIDGVAAGLEPVGHRGHVFRHRYDWVDGAPSSVE